MTLVDRLERLLGFVSAACLLAMGVGVFLQVLLRYGFSYTPVWSEEVLRMLLLWCVVCGAAVSVRGNEHIRVEFIVDQLPVPLRRAWTLVVDLVTLSFFVAVVVASVDAVPFNHTMRTVALQWPMSWLIVAIPIGLGSAAIFLVARMAAQARSGGLRHRVPPRSGKRP
ncbi:MAG: TRAP transporter small permease [Lautropia sp.]